jgi:predicted PurR-regulated permease PerM
MTQLPPSHVKSASLSQRWDNILPAVTRVLVWLLFFSVFYILRSFFLLIFFTFVFAYIQNSSIQKIERLIANRTVRAFLVATIMFGTLTTVVIFVVPKVKSQAEFFVSQFATYIHRADQEFFKLSEKYPLLKEAIPAARVDASATAAETKNTLKNSPIVSIIQQMAGIREERAVLEKVNEIIDTLGRISGKVASVTSAFLLSLLFSFLIVLDLPKLGKSVTELEQTRLRFIYIEVAENIRDFATVLGRALEAQFLIAVVNSFLTAIGISLLGLGNNVAFLSVIVFFCSFIPVVGVFISSLPICLIALQTSGLQTLFLSILMVVAIHLIEGYVLNPKIYGSHMRIHPVIVLIILTIGGKLFHFWGLILGVPVCTYVFGHAIHARKRLSQCVAAPEVADTGQSGTAEKDEKA